LIALANLLFTYHLVTLLCSYYIESVVYNKSIPFFSKTRDTGGILVVLAQYKLPGIALYLSTHVRMAGLSP